MEADFDVNAYKNPVGNNNNNNNNINNNNNSSFSIDPIPGKINSIFRSNIFCTFAKGLVGIALTAIAFKASILVSIPFILNPVSLGMIVGGCVTTFIVWEVVRLRKHFLFEVSVINTLTNKKPWWNPITKHIILGAIPLENQFKQLKKEVNIGAVLTLLEPFELEKGLLAPIQKNFWVDKEVEHLHIEAQDFVGVAKDKIVEGVEFLHKQIQQNNKVYVHCKAGRGRSATIVVAYLLKYGYNNQAFKNFDEAYAFVKRHREQINLNPRQRAAVELWWKAIYV